MQEMTKEQLQEQLQIEIYNSISLQEELNQKNKERAEYKALYTFAEKKRKELQEQLNAALSANEGRSEPAPVTEQVFLFCLEGGDQNGGNTCVDEF